MWLTMGLAIERYLSMRRLSRVQQWCTAWRTRALLASLVLLSDVMNVPSLFVVEVKSNGSKGDTVFGKSSYYTVFSIARLTLFQFGALAVIICFNVLLIRVTLVQRKKRISRQQKSFALNSCAEHVELNNTPATTPNLITNASLTQSVNANRSPRRLTPREKAEYKLTIMCIAMIVIFLMGHIPVAFSYARIYGLLFGRIRTPQHQLFSRVTLAISVLAFTLNFWMYVALNRRFRDALLCRATANERSARMAPERVTTCASPNELRRGQSPVQPLSISSDRSKEKIVENGV